MTYRDLMQIEHPNAIDPLYIGGVASCPSLQGYEAKAPDACCTAHSSPPTDAQCRACWNREAPYETTESVLLSQGLDVSEYTRERTEST